MDRTRINPDFDDVLSILKNNIFASLNCIQIGKIEEYDTATQTVSVALQVKARSNGDAIIEYPLLVDCPVVVMQGGGAYLEFPIAAGDFCLVLFNDRDMDNWFTAANVTAPKTRRKHSLSDGFALVGINPQTKLLDLDGSVVRLLGPSGAGAEEFAARVNDTITIDATTDPTFFIFLEAVASALSLTAPASVTGKISTGSTGVKIG